MLALVALAGCDDGAELKPATLHTESDHIGAGITASPSEPVPSETRRDKPKANKWVTPRPAWLGTRVLPLRGDGFGETQPTPPILRTRSFATIDILPPPRSERFKATIDPVPDDVVERSTWRPVCPISLDGLSYLTMTYWGFDHEAHTGEMIVNATVAEQITGVFRKLYEARFEIEEMRVVTLKEQRDQHKAPTGDTNVTSSFECRRATLNSTWSMHAVGLAIDINPFHNPYVRGDLVAPELATAYADRTWVRPGMVLEGGVVSDAFDAIGWGWGGRWNSFKDYMHFSQNGH
jgi:D-alanyl-D-alanine carboxypeptidase-like protein